MSVFSRIRAAVSAARSAYAAGRNPAGRPMWRPPTGGARRTTSEAMQLIADRARDAVRNNPYAARIVDIWAANMVGTGITTRWDNAALGRAWARWATSLECDAEGQQDWSGIQVLCARAMVESGEVLIRFRQVRPTFRNPLGLRLHVIEADLLDTSRTGFNGPNRIVQGIEVNAAGAPVAYWLREDYQDWPGSLLPVKAERVPAEQIIHLYRRRRPGQLRDVSWLAPVLWMLRDLGTYEAALLRKAEIEACMSVIVNDDSDETATGGLVTDAMGQTVEDIQPGLILYRKGSGQIETVQPSGGGSHVGFAKRTLEAAAVGAGLTYDQVSGDLSQANYSSLRAGKIEFRRLLEQVQYTIIIPRLIERVAERFHELGVVRGLWADEMAERSHVPPAPEMVDPMKDTMALIAQIRAGFVDPKDGPGAFGYDARAVMDALAEWNAAADDAGVVLDTDPRRVAKTGAAHDAAQLAAVEIGATGAAIPQQPGPAADAARDADAALTRRLIEMLDAGDRR